MRKAERLTALTVRRLSKPGRHADGGNLYLSIDKEGRKKWTFFYQLNDRQREMGLGALNAVGLGKAREKAAKAREMLADGIDPLDAKREAKRAAQARKTFGQVAADYFEAQSSKWSNAKHTGQWRQTIDVHLRRLRDIPVEQINTDEILSVLRQLWKKTPETASRVRARIEMVLDSATARGLRQGDNPASWKGHLETLLPARQRIDRGHHAALPYSDVPAFLARLREQDTAAALALEFTILTATRAGEVIGAARQEIDLDAKVWTVPASRMKAKREHRIPLCDRAVEILGELAVFGSAGIVFPGKVAGRPMAAASMWQTARRIDKTATVHGFRSAFRDWAGNETSFPREIAEAALSHVAGDATEQAHRRGDALEKRRALMAAWASFCQPGSGGNVIALARTAVGA